MTIARGKGWSFGLARHHRAWWLGWLLEEGLLTAGAGPFLLELNVSLITGRWYTKRIS